VDIESLRPIVAQIFFIVVALLPILNPAGQAPIFLNFTAQASLKLRNSIAKKVAIASFITLLVAMFIGSFVLRFFGISIPALQVGGGLLVVVTGWNLLSAEDPNQQSASTKSADIEEISLGKLLVDKVFYPMTFPLTVGPGSISVAIALGANSHSREPRLLILLLSSTIGLMIVSAVVYLSYRYSVRLVGFLGERGTNIFLRMSAFILLCLGVQIMWNGIQAFIKTL
jgi:multiple antibiotic resistance protein